MAELDQFDREILDLVQLDSRQTGQQLSERIGLSPAACLRRVQRLKKIGAIEREVAIVAPEFDPRRTQVIVLLSVARDNPQRLEKVRQKLSKLREVERIYYITGQADFVLMVKCDSMEHYAEFTETHLYEPPLKGFESLVVMREYRNQLEDTAGK